MTERYELPVLFTEEERNTYAAWGIKKRKSTDAVCHSDNLDLCGDGGICRNESLGRAGRVIMCCSRCWYWATGSRN